MSRVNKAEEKAYNYIKEQIMTGSWPAPTKIIEQEISDVLEISRSPVRAAIKQLADEGFLDLVPYKGAVVAEKKLDKQEFIDRMEMFEMLMHQYIFLIENHKFHLNQEVLQMKIDEIYEAMKNNCDLKQLSHLDTELMEDILVEQPNSFIRKTIISISKDVLNVDFQRSTQKVYDLYKIFIIGIEKMINHLSNEEFQKARKEVRIFINKLMLEVIDQSMAS